MPGHRSVQYAHRMRRILIIDGHPHDSRDHYVHALASAYAKGAEDLHEVRRIDLAKLDFPMLRDPDEWKSSSVPESLAQAQASMAWADHLVILYPLWMGAMPALLKGFLEQVARPGFAVETLDNGLYRKLLKGKSARIIVTMGMPAIAYSLFFRAHSVKSLKRNILGFAGVSPVRLTLIGSIDKSKKYRQHWLRKIESLGRSGQFG